MRHKNRETWLNYIAQKMGSMFIAVGSPLPDKVRIAMGFTSTGRRGRAAGECWDNRCSADGHFEIFIRPDLIEAEDMMPGQVAAILAHELVHAAVGIEAGHGKEFRRVAKGIGLQGKMRATTAGPKFLTTIEPILEGAGALPHSRLETTGRKKDSNRHIKCECKKCGYAARTSRKWLVTLGPPHCPKHGQMQEVVDEN